MGEVVALMFFPSQHRGGSERFYRTRFALLVAGIAAILAGIRWELSWPVNVGIGILAVAVVLRFLPQRKRDEETDVH